MAAQSKAIVYVPSLVQSRTDGGASFCVLYKPKKLDSHGLHWATAPQKKSHSCGNMIYSLHVTDQTIRMLISYCPCLL
jgi:hypothetical protein